MFENLSDEDAALQADSRLTELENQYRKTFAERGLLLLEAENRRLWSKIINPEDGLYFASFKRWIVVRAPHSASDCYAALAAVKELKDIPQSDLLEIPRCNLSTMQTLSTAVRRDPEVIKVAKTRSNNELISHIEKNHPDQHLEHRQRITLNPSQSQYKAITEALDTAKVYYGVGTLEEALEAVLADWRQAEDPERKIEAYSPTVVM